MSQDGFRLPTIDVGTKAANSNNRANIQAQKQKGAFRLPCPSELDLDRSLDLILAFKLADFCPQFFNLSISPCEITRKDDSHRVGFVVAFHVIRLWSLLDGQT